MDSGCLELHSQPYRVGFDDDAADHDETGRLGIPALPSPRPHLGSGAGLKISPGPKVVMVITVTDLQLRLCCCQREPETLLPGKVYLITYLMKNDAIDEKAVVLCVQGLSSFLPAAPGEGPFQA